ncbi:MAG: VanW family protein [Lachnospiraceae bacterium]|nr:VanW family protein [Lachnospiraceae bacterium]
MKKNRRKQRRRKQKVWLPLVLLGVAGAAAVFWYSSSTRAVAVQTDHKAYYLEGVSGEEDRDQISVMRDAVVYSGVHVGAVDISGMTIEQAAEAVENYYTQVCEAEVTLIAAQNTPVTVKLSDLAPYWENREVLDDLLELTDGNDVIDRYMMKKDIAQNGMDLPLAISFDKETVVEFLQKNCSIYDVPLQNATLRRENGQFIVEEGQAGEGVNLAEAAGMIQGGLFEEVVAGNTQIVLPLEELYPMGQAEELAQVKDLLGTFTTSFSSSGAARSTNVSNGCHLIDGTLLYPGEEFSAYNTIKPFTEENGYRLAGSYLNGKVVESLGGGICQVSSTLYNAVLRAELQVTERHNHSMVVTYVDKSADAAIAESAGKDFRFVNNTEHPIYIEGYTSDKKITFNVYGVETRDPGRRVSFESEVVSENPPKNESIIADGGQVVGYVSVTNAHIGYQARLWKVVTQNGKEIERSVVNESKYNPSPRTAVVGIAAADPNYTAMMQQAIATGSIDQCKQTAAAIKAHQAEQEALAAQMAAEVPVVTEVTAAQSDSVAP